MRESSDKPHKPPFLYGGLIVLLGVLLGAGGFLLGTQLSMSARDTSPPISLSAAVTQPVYGQGGSFAGCVGSAQQVKMLPSPERVLNTSTGLGTKDASEVAPGSTTIVNVSSLLPGASAVLGTFTISGATGYGYFTLWSGVGQRPLTSNLNTFAGSVSALADAAMIPLSPQGTFAIYDHGVSANLIFDVAGGIYDTTGQLTLLSEGSSCPSGSKEVTWSTQGPPGPQGAQGPQGPQGPAGPGEQVFTASTSPYTYTVPTGVSYLKVEMWGGGGGGADGFGVRSGHALLVGDGGGSGAFLEALVPVTGGTTTCTVVVGSGGPGGTISVQKGSTGEPSKVTCLSTDLVAGPGSGGGRVAQNSGAGGVYRPPPSSVTVIGATSGQSGFSGSASGGGAGGGYYNSPGGAGGTKTHGKGYPGRSSGTGGGGAMMGQGGNGANGLVVITPIA